MADLITSANVDTLMQAANFAAFRTSLGLGALSTVTPGTGVATAVAVNVGSAGAFVVLGGAGGTPSSIVLTNGTGLVATTGLTATGTKNSTTFLRGDNTWDVPAGGGDVAGPASATDNAVVVFDGATGKLVQNSVVIVDPATGDITGIGDITGDSVAVTTLVVGGVTITATGTEINYIDGVTSAIQTQLDAKAPLASPTFTGTVTIPASALTGNQNIAAVPSSDHTARGPTTSIFNLGATIALMDLMYLGSSSKWLLTDADAVATAQGMLGICLDGGVDTDTTTAALSGSFVRDDTWNWTPGALLYVDTATPGAITATAPSGTDDVIRVVGWAVTADVIYFCPSPDNITHV
jgi:hypothetical protein